MERKGTREMNKEELENAEKWAVQTFGTAELGDPRRTDRLVTMAAALAENPAASLPKSMRNWADTQAAYRLLGNAAITHEQIMAPRLYANPRGGAPTPARLIVGRHDRHQPFDT